MNYKVQSRGMLFLAAIAGLAFTGCTKDSAYDKLTEDDGIDLTVSILRDGLTIPLGSTDTIFATELIDPDDSENISLDEFGNYYMGTDGTLDPSDVTVAEARIDVPKVQFPTIPYVFQITNLTDAQQTAINAMGPLTPLVALGSLSNPDIATPTTGNDVPDTLIIINANGVDAALLEISTVAFERQNAPMKSVLSFALTDLPNAAAEYDVTLQNVRLELPDFMVAENPQGVKYPQGWISLPNVTAHKPAGSNALTVRSEDIIISGMDFSDSPLKNESGKLHRETRIGIYSEVAISNMSSLSGSDVLYLYSLSSKPYFTFTAGTKLAISLETTSVTMETIYGKFFPTINPISTDVSINLGDDLDFLQADDVVLDIKNPQATVNLTNECKIGIFAKAVFTSDKGKQVTFDQVRLTPLGDNTSAKIVFKAKPEAGDDPLFTFYNEDFSTFVEPVPDVISVLITPVADSTQVYQYKLGNTMHISGDYAVRVPFDFNRIHITYDERSEDVFDNKSNDDDKLSETLNEIQNASVQFNVTSTLGLDIKLDLIATDLNGNEDPSLIAFETVSIPGGTFENPTVTDVNMNLSINDISKIQDLIFRLHGDATDRSLTSKQYLILKDVKVTLKNLVLDLNDND